MIEPPAAEVMILPEAPPGPEATRNLLLTLPPLGPSCQRSAADEIVVCGRRDDNRHDFGPPLPEAPVLMDDLKGLVNVSIGSVQIKPEAVHSLVSNGNGIAVKIPF
ncbi:hypothetical protein [Sphingosinicella rhizophila]|uniref:Uncharacterized protein n=1 Tax=Sphingosinicella rhizophila TaxID=3050082 RepID=A0ABU3Q9R9_9SPHN|nr:hypothetical protein [Sphingosinicella sp. GR2756]MDT9600155.1 hypothetical protein [Sphingosinicella sp. GR2756]